MKWLRRENREAEPDAVDAGAADVELSEPEEPVAHELPVAPVAPMESSEEPDNELPALIDATDVPVAATTAAEPDDRWLTDRPAPEVLADPDAERRQLIDLLIYAWDRAKSPGVWERLTEGLGAVGVSILRPDGESFDPARHEVGGVEPTEDDDLVDRIAETELVGFADRGQVIREPVVVVYRKAGR